MNNPPNHLKYARPLPKHIWWKELLPKNEKERKQRLLIAVLVSGLFLLTIVYYIAQNPNKHLSITNILLFFFVSLIFSLISAVLTFFLRPKATFIGICITFIVAALSEYIQLNTNVYIESPRVPDFNAVLVLSIIIWLLFFSNSLAIAKIILTRYDLYFHYDKKSLILASAIILSILVSFYFENVLNIIKIPYLLFLAILTFYSFFAARKISSLEQLSIIVVSAIIIGAIIEIQSTIFSIQDSTYFISRVFLWPLKLTAIIGIILQMYPIFVKEDYDALYELQIF